MLAFRSEGHLEAWLEQRGIVRGATLTLAQQWGLARIWYADRLSPEWRRKTPDEAELVFSQLGLTGSFWKLS